MTLADRFESLLPDLAGVVRRFPVPAFLAFALCLYLNWRVGSSDPLTATVITSTSAAFLAAGAKHLSLESWHFPRLLNIVSAAIAAAVVGAVAWYQDVFQTSELFLFASLVLALMVAPYLTRNARQGALWLFNLRLGLAALLAFVVGLVFGAGLSAIVAALNFLLGIDLGSDSYSHIWITAAALVAPVYGLSLMPKDLTEEINIADHADSVMERGVSVLVNYVLAPLLLVYALILHAYAAKIVLVGELPKGEIGTIVSLFAVGGTTAWLIAWPWRETGTRLLRLFMRGWFWLIPVPAVLLVMAIMRRVGDYGWTPDRYGIAIIAVWIVIVFIYLVIRRNRADLRVIIGAAAILFLAAAFGPQGAYGVTAASQLPRLEALLSETGLLKDGKLVSAPPAIDLAKRDKAATMIDVLGEVHALDRLKPWLGEGETPPVAKADDTYELAMFYRNRLGFGAWAPPVGSINFSSVEPQDLRIMARSRLVGPVTVSANAKEPLKPVTGIEISMTDKEWRIVNEGQTTSFALPPLLEALQKAQVVSPAKSPLEWTVDDKTKLLITQAVGSNEPGKAAMSYMVFWLLIAE